MDFLSTCCRRAAMCCTSHSRPAVLLGEQRLSGGSRAEGQVPRAKADRHRLLCSSSGYGLLVDYAADMRDAGEDIDTVAQWVLDNRNKVHHQFFSSDMTQFRRTGRVSGAAATVATVLNICPIMRLDDKGAIKAYSKVRGQEKKPWRPRWTPWSSTPRAAGTMTASALSATASARRTPGWSWTPWRTVSPS